MRRIDNVALVSLGLLLGTAACNPFLNDVARDPNRPTAASVSQLLVGMQAAQFALQEGTIAMEMCLWTQACGATNGRFVQQAYNYVFGEGTDIGSNGGDWALIYDAGGLIDLRQIENIARAQGDDLSLGIAQAWEAFAIGTAADMWGNVPYSQALVNQTPALDNQADVYAAVQAKLDSAIANVAAGGPGPGAGDLVFGGNAGRWTRAMYTLKARYHLHTAEALGDPAYDAALAAAQNGISAQDGSEDWGPTHTTRTSERNMWTQFQTSSGFGNDLEAGKVLVDLMKGRADPRLAFYFCKNVTTPWQANHAYSLGTRILGSNGYAQRVTTAGTSGSSEPAWTANPGDTRTDGTVVWTNDGLPYGGDDPNAAQPNVSNFLCLPPRFDAQARIPYVSYAENELIMAEALSSAAVNRTAGFNDAQALVHLNNARHYVNAAFPAQAPLQALPDVPNTVTGVALLDSIMTEKYIAMFQNIEIMSGYQRECIPALVPATNNRGFTNVPARLYYPLAERNANPNIPDPSTQNSTNGFRNPLDPHGCNGDAR
jgi:hypothetical protein